MIRVKTPSFIHRNRTRWMGPVAGALLMTAMVAGCNEPLPEVGSIEDLTPPSADFSFRASSEDFRQIEFTNLSLSANQYAWDFGDGSTSEDQHPVHSFSGEGTFTVVLRASDGNGVTATAEIDVDVVDELVPIFECNSFECDDRSVWGSFSGSGSPTPPDGTTGAKLESDSHFLDQTIRVSTNSTYEVSFWYVSANSAGTNCGNLKLSDGDDDTNVFVEEGVPLTDNASNYVQVFYTVSTGSAENLRFQLTPGDVTGRYDLVEIRKIQ
ncbi:MAG: PKD domain-containing protein [Bacteroidota bacterium]